MSKFSFALHVSTDNDTGDVLAVYFQVRKGKAASVREFSDGLAFANYGRDGKLLGVELLGPCEISVLDRISRGEPVVRRFLRRSIPRELALSGPGGAGKRMEAVRHD